MTSSFQPKIKNRAGIHADLEYFLAVAQTESLSEAARHLQVEQPTLSRALMRLESKLQFKLFFRSRQGLTLTPEGVEFYRKSFQWAEEWLGVERLDQQEEGRLHGHLSIGCHPVLAIDFLSPLLKKLLVIAPELQISLLHDLSIRITELVNEAKLDVGLVVDPVPHPDLVIQKLDVGRVYLWSLKKATALQDYKKEEGVIFFHPQMMGVQKILQSLKKEKNFLARKFIPSNDYEVIRNFVSQGLGIGVLPEHAGLRVRVDPSATELVPLDLAIPKLENDIAFIYRAEKKASRFFSKLLKVIQLNNR